MATRGDSSGSQYTFLVVKHNSICEESKVEKEGFEPVEVFNPKTKETITKYIDKWGSVTGFVNNIETYDTGETYDTRFQGIKINIDDEVILDLPQKTPAWDTFCKLAENIDFSKEVTFSADKDKKNDRTAFFVKQDGEGVKWKYTKAEPNGCPEWERDEDGEWDSRKQRAFLKQKMVDVVIPACKAEATKRAGEFDPEMVELVETTPIAEAAAATPSSPRRSRPPTPAR